MRILPVAALCLFPLAASAECVTLWDMTNDPGAVFKMQTGPGIEISRRTVENSIAEAHVLYRSKPVDEQMARVARSGVFETEDRANRTDPATDALLLTTVYRRFSGRLPEIVPGKSWTTRVTEKTEVVNTLTDETTTSKEQLTATFTFLPASSVKLSGCQYEIIPVEATFSGDATQRSRRWIYFPALKVAVQTREQDHRTGTEVKNGIVGLVTLKSVQ